TNRLQRMIQDLADYSLLQDRPDSSNTEVVDLTDVVRTDCEEFQMFETSHRLLVQLPVSPVFVTGDRSMVSRILGNLLSNAFKYSPADSTVLVRLKPSRRRASVCIEVEDEGRGIPKANRAVAFDPFVRLANSDETSGQGLGLFVVKKMVEALRGQV